MTISTIGFATGTTEETQTQTSPINHFGYSAEITYPGTNEKPELAVVMFHSQEMAEDIRRDGIAEGVPTYSEVKPYHMPCGTYEIDGIHYHCVDWEVGADV